MSHQWIKCKFAYVNLLRICVHSQNGRRSSSFTCSINTLLRWSSEKQICSTGNKENYHVEMEQEWNKELSLFKCALTASLPLSRNSSWKTFYCGESSRHIISFWQVRSLILQVWFFEMMMNPRLYCSLVRLPICWNIVCYLFSTSNFPEWKLTMQKRVNTHSKNVFPECNWPSNYYWDW